MRPADPDTTGGFYQPVRATWQSDAGPLLAFAQQRITCALANAPTDIAAMYAAHYIPNNNPTLTDLVLDPADAMTTLYVAGETTAGHGLGGQKVVLAGRLQRRVGGDLPGLDVLTLTLDTQRESLRLSWFATAGALRARRDRAQPDGAGDASPRTSRTAPMTPGPVYFWTVLRDDRGGIDFAGAGST